MKYTFFVSLFIFVLAVPVLAQTSATYSAEIGGSVDASIAPTAESGECWNNPTKNPPGEGSYEQSTRVDCSDPTCNEGPCVEMRVVEQLVLPADSGECWYNPTYDGQRAPNIRVSCDDPTCNEGPCTNGVMIDGEASVSVDGSTAVPVSVHGTEDINIGVGELQEESDENPTDDSASAEAVANAQAEVETPNIFVRFWLFLTAWF